MKEIKQIQWGEVQKVSSMLKKERVICKDDGTIYFGMYEGDALIGLTGYRKINKGIRYKSSWVHKNHRGNGYYKMLIEHLDKVVSGMDYDKVTAFCTPGTWSTLEKLGFKFLKKDIDKKIAYVERKKNEEL